MNVIGSTWQRIPRSRLHLVDTISDSQKGPGLLYEGELGDTSVIVKCYRRKRRGQDEIEPEEVSVLFTPLSVYLIAGAS
jgi:hypothetical protein